MKILLLGKNGMLAQAILSVFKGKHEIIATAHSECDITKPEDIVRWVDSVSPKMVINATGYTKVDLAEKEKDLAYKVNAEGVGNIARVLSDKNIPLIHFSTDYVFNGENQDGYYEDASYSPISVYGASKAEGEKEIVKNMKKYFIVRTSWLYGPGGTNFVDTMLNLARKKENIRVVCDQTGCPTYTFDLAQAILKLSDGDKYGIYHLTNDGSTTWYDFSVEIFNQLGIPILITKIASDENNKPAKRPRYSILINSKFPNLRYWKDALTIFLGNKTLIL